MNPEIDPILNILSMAPLTIAQFFYSAKLIKIKNRNVYVFTGTCISMLVVYLNGIGIISNALGSGSALLFQIFYAMLFIKKEYIQAVVIGGINCIVQFACEGSVALFSFIFFGKSYYELMNNPFVLVGFRIEFLIVYCFLMSSIVSFWEKRSNKAYSGTITYLPLILIQVSFFYICVYSFWKRAMTREAAIIMFGVSCLNILLDILMYVFLKETSKNEVESYKEGQLRVQLEHQKNREEELLKDQKKAMNIKKMVITGLQDAKKMISQRDGTGATQHLAEITEQFAWKRLYSENRVVDAVVSDKAKECTEKNIRLQTELDIPEKLPVKNAELCVIFANLLDNAIRACERLEGQEKPKDHDCAEIRLAARERGGYLVIREENPFDGTVEDRKQGPLSEHGLGLGIVEQIAQKHEGRLQTEQAEGKFITVVMLKI